MKFTSVVINSKEQIGWATSYYISYGPPQNSQSKSAEVLTLFMDICWHMVLASLFSCPQDHTWVTSRFYLQCKFVRAPVSCKHIFSSKM